MDESQTAKTTQPTITNPKILLWILMIVYVFNFLDRQIVNILAENKAVKKDNLTAAGRGEYAPLMSNDTPEGKAKNRRIEIILTPKLDEISKMLNEL